MGEKNRVRKGNAGYFRPYSGIKRDPETQKIITFEKPSIKRSQEKPRCDYLRNRKSGQ